MNFAFKMMNFAFKMMNFVFIYARQLGIASGFDPYRLMLFTRVMKVPSGYQASSAASPASHPAGHSAAAATEGGSEGGRMTRMTLAFKESEAWNIYELFHARYTLHKRAYQHRTANCIEGMLCEVLALANQHVTLPGTDGNTCTLYDAVWDMEAYTTLTDSIFNYIILRQDLAVLKPAQLLLNKIHTRQHHRYIGESVIIESSQSQSKEHWKADCKVSKMMIF